MRSKIVGFILFALMGINFFGVAKRPTNTSYTQTHGLQEELLPAFYLSEGIKNTSVYNDEERSLEYFEKAIEIDTTHAPSYFYTAKILIDSDIKKAINYTSRASKLDPKNVWYRTQLGQLYIMDQQYVNARKVYQYLVRNTPPDPNNYRLLAALYQQTNHPFTAISVLDSAEYKLGRIEELSDFKRQLLIQVNMLDQAIAESEAILQDFPDDEDNLLILAELYGATKNDSLALNYYNKAFKMNPQNANVLLSLNQFHKSKNDVKNILKTTVQLLRNKDITLDAKINFIKELMGNLDFYSSNYYQISNLTNTLMLRYPKEYDVIKLTADHHIAARKIEEALQLYKIKLSDGVTDIRVFNDILDIEAYFNNQDSVAKYAQLALTIYPNNPNIYMRKASSLSYMKQNKEALKTYQEAIELAPTDSLKSVIYGLMGDVYYSDNKNKSAFKYYDIALKLDNNNALVLNNYSYCIITTQHKKELYEKALTMAEQAIASNRDNPTYLDTYAWALYKLGKYSEAKKIMQQALSLDKTNNEELLIHYGDILYELEEYFMARVYWRKALEAGYNAKEIELRLEKIKDK